MSNTHTIAKELGKMITRKIVDAEAKDKAGEPVYHEFQKVTYLGVDECTHVTVQGNASSSAGSIYLNNQVREEGVTGDGLSTTHSSRFDASVHVNENATVRAMGLNGSHRSFIAVEFKAGELIGASEITNFVSVSQAKMMIAELQAAIKELEVTA
jgi:hypothetical protein